MKKFFSLLCLIFFSHVLMAQNKDTANVSITGFTLNPGTFSWRGTGTYRDMTSFQSNPYTEGHLRQGTQYRMNYRLLFPVGHNTTYQPGYPLIVMLHGAGERGNCWNDNCYCPGTGCGANDTPKPGTDDRFLNNDHNLTHGGGPHLTARNLAGTKLPNDPTLNSRAFPGFVLFPQMTNQWRNSSSPSQSDLSYAIRIVRILSRQYNIDPDRIYIHGLSMGGQAVLEALNYTDWLFAAAAPMSALSFQNSLEYDSVRNIPIWLFQGGTDTNPRPSQTETMVRNLREKGANVRYTLYPTLGHGTWNSAYAEPDFFSWLLKQNKSNIHIDFNNPNICGTTNAAPTLRLPQGFPAYQWERDGVIIPGATTENYLATTPGVYRARFSRKSANPTEAQWNRWSDPVTVGEKTPEAPNVEQISTIVLSDLNGGSIAYLNGPPDYPTYKWYQNGTLVNFVVPVNAAEPNKFRIQGCTGASGTGTPCAQNGAYTLVTEGFDKCPSLPSKTKYVFFGTHGTTPRAITVTPSGFVGVPKSPTTVVLNWNDVTRNERGYEIWRRRLDTTIPTNRGWVMAGLTEEDATVFVDNGVAPASTYWYKIRSVNNLGRSNYFPGNNTSAQQSLTVVTPGESTIPTPPYNLTADAISETQIQLRWEPATDASGIRQYFIHFNGDSIATNSLSTTYVLNSLPLNATYTFTVKAQDTGGNISFPSNPAVASTIFTGLFYKHTTGVWTLLSQMTSTWTAPEYTGRVNNFSLQPRTQDDFFNFEFSGYIYIQTGGTYTFYINSDDGSEIAINDAQVAIYDGTHGLCGNSATCPNGWGRFGSVNLAAGPHKIRVRYFENTGGQQLFVRYRGPDTNNTTIMIPDAALRSANPLPLPVPPVAPTDLAAAPNGIQSINLTWNHATPGMAFEIFRGGIDSTTFKMVSRSSTTSFSDTGLRPDSTYYYKVRAVVTDTVSAFSPTAFATTAPDNTAPTQPTALAVFRVSYSTISLTWTASTDVNGGGVAGYEVYRNGVFIGTSPSTAFQVTDLEPSTGYSFYVIAYDQNNNKSTPSNTVNSATNDVVVYRTVGSGSALNLLSSWNGPGGAPTSFINNGQYFVVEHPQPVTQKWSVEGSVSKVIVENGITMTIDAQPVEARIDIPGTGVLNLIHQTLPELGELSSSSTVNYTNKFIQATTYGNLGLQTSGAFNFPIGTTDILGNLSGAAGASIKGGSGNTSNIRLSGNLTMAGTPAPLATSFTVGMELIGSGSQTITSGGNLDLFKIEKSGSGDVNVVNSGSPYTVNAGSTAGGGVILPTGTSLNLGANSLNVVQGGSVNGSNQAGTISINDGSITIASTGSTNSNLRFDPAGNSIHTLTSDISGSADIIVLTAVNITDGIKIKRGEVVSNGNITLVSNSTKTANLQEIENNGQLTGNVNVQRYVDPKARTYRYISSPVSGTTIANWQQFFAITGNFDGASSRTNSSLFHYQEPSGWLGYPLTTNPAPYNNNLAPIERGKGYAAFVRNTTPFVMQVAGVPYQGPTTFTITPPQSGVPDTGWNLLGNPFAATIAWTNDASAWTRSGINSVVAVRNNTAIGVGQFEYFDASTGLGTGVGGVLEGGLIAPGQAFWVQATSATPSLTINERAKVNAQQTLFREDEQSPVSQLRINLKQASRADQALIVITDFGTDEFDPEFDALKRPNEGMYNFSTLTSNGLGVAINNTIDSFCSKEVGLKLNNLTAGTYSLSVESAELFTGVGSITLRDRFTNTSINLREAGEYSFTVTSDTATFGSNRFRLSFDRPELDDQFITSVNRQCGLLPVVQLKNTQAGAYYSLLGVNGESVIQAQVAKGGDLDFNVPASILNEGVNTLRVKAMFKGCTDQESIKEITFEYYSAPALIVRELSICRGSTATLTAEGNKPGYGYQWYSEDGSPLKGANSSTFVTGPADKQTFYSVASVMPDGCAGSKTTTHISVDDVLVPVITFENDTLYSDVHEGEYAWTYNDEEIQGWNKTFLAAALSGEYKVKVTKGGCSVFSMPITVEEKLSEGGFLYSVSPNPTTSDNIHVQVISSEKLPVRIRMIDVLGRPVLDQVFADDLLKTGVVLNTSETVKAGLYFLILEQKSKSKKIRIILTE